MLVVVDVVVVNVFVAVVDVTEVTVSVLVVVVTVVDDAVVVVVVVHFPHWAGHTPLARSPLTPSALQKKTNLVPHSSPPGSGTPSQVGAGTEASVVSVLEVVIWTDLSPPSPLLPDALPLPNSSSPIPLPSASFPLKEAAVEDGAAVGAEHDPHNSGHS